MSSRPPNEDMEATRVSNLVELQNELAQRTQRDRAYLIVLAGTNVGEMYRLEGAETVIGRASNATIRLNDDGISRRHARLLQVAGEVLIEDLKSANGTLVNGDTIEQRSLKDGDKIRLGSTTILKFTYHDNLDESFQQQMYEAALRDGLTKAFNKKYFLDRLETEIAFAKRHRTDLSLLMFDVDHFKRVNDTFGHLAGDFVLRKLAEIAQATVRTEDVFARYGGEEFVVILRGVDLAGAARAGERLRGAISAASPAVSGKLIPVTISVGAASLACGSRHSGEELVAIADRRLYAAKHAGRNRVDSSA